MIEELKTYVNFSPSDAGRLHEAQGFIVPHIGAIVDRFYDAILSNPKALAVFADAAQIERQKVSLSKWMSGLFQGVYDEAYYDRRFRIGRVHVRVGLEQRYMFGGMNIIRGGLCKVVRGANWDTVKATETCVAINKICDIELAIMLESYREAYLDRISAGERLAALGQVAGAIGHDLRNPLAVLQTSAHLLSERVQGEPALESHVEKIERQANVMTGIVTSLLSLTRDTPSPRQEVPIESTIHEAIQQARIPDNVEIKVHVDPSAKTAWVEKNQFNQVIYNLTKNAIEAMDTTGGRVQLNVRALGNELSVEVSDDGPGLSDEIRDTLFQPLTTTKRGGFGIGLALCRHIVEKHGGTISGNNLPDGGARFMVSIPDAISS